MNLSSDTNVWLDYYIIDGLHLPFRLNHIFYMSSEAISDEVLSPTELGGKLYDLGLVPIEITEEEFFFAFRINGDYSRLSSYDAIALAIAILRGFDLLSGDKALRVAANSEGIKVRGTLWIYDELVTNGRISIEERFNLLKLLEENNGNCKGIRLPAHEIKKRLEDIQV